MGTWAYSYSFSTAEALTELAIKAVENNQKEFTLTDILEALDSSTNGSKWNGSLMRDTHGVEVSNSFFVYQDTYILGKGYLGMSSQKIPEKYFK
jgi:lipoprotein